MAGREYVISGLPFANRDDSVSFVDDQRRLMEKASSTTVTTPEWSLIYAVERGLSELYHLPSDPKQGKNVINEHPDIARELHQLLIDFMRETNVASRLLEPRSELKL